MLEVIPREMQIPRLHNYQLLTDKSKAISGKSTGTAT
jgi:hypothetical protein